MGRVTNFWLLAGSIVVQCPAIAQPSFGDADRETSSSTTIIVRSRQVSSDSVPQGPQFTTVTYSVPVADIHEYVFDILSVTNGGAGGGSTSETQPDEHGIIHARGMRNPTVDQYYFLFATHRDSGDQYFDLDLPPLRLSPVLGAIGLALGKARSTRMVMPVFAAAADRDVVVQIQGERISPEAVFDIIWEQTGCDIADEGARLRVTDCLELNDRMERP